jgi:arylformamidase
LPLGPHTRIVDLSHAMIPGKEEYGLALETHQTAELYPQYPVDSGTWYILQTLHMGSHCGTHIEFPYHHKRDGLDAASFPFERLIGDCVLLDFRHKRANEAVTLAELEERETRIQPGDMVLFNFGCAQRYGTQKGHERPYIGHDAIRWLVLEKAINIIGSDASGIEIKGAPNQPNHQFLMDHQVPIIEFANNLDAVQTERFTLVVLALPVVGLDSCPVRLVAIEQIHEPGGQQPIP